MHYGYVYMLEIKCYLQVPMCFQRLFFPPMFIDSYMFSVGGICDKISPLYTGTFYSTSKNYKI